MTQSPRIVITAQIFISGMMAGLMTLFFGALHTGFGPALLIAWRDSFVIAWPLAFVLSLGVGPLAFRMARRLHHRQA